MTCTPSWVKGNIHSFCLVVVCLLVVLCLMSYLFSLFCGKTTTPNFSTNIVPTNIAWVKLSGKSPTGLGIPPRKIKIMLESNPPNSTMLVGRLGVHPTSELPGQEGKEHGEQHLRVACSVFVFCCVVVLRVCSINSGFAVFLCAVVL